MHSISMYTLDRVLESPSLLQHPILNLFCLYSPSSFTWLKNCLTILIYITIFLKLHMKYNQPVTNPFEFFTIILLTYN